MRLLSPIYSVPHKNLLLPLSPSLLFIPSPLFVPSTVPFLCSLPSLPSLNYHDFLSSSVKNKDKPCPNGPCRPEREVDINHIIVQITVVVSAVKQRYVAL